MAQTFSETKPIRDQLNRIQQQQQYENLRTQQALGEKMSQLAADPTWGVYVRGIEERKREFEKQLKDSNDRLCNIVMSPDKYLEEKVHQAYVRGTVSAYEFALDIIKELIAEGENAKKELEKS